MTSLTSKVRVLSFGDLESEAFLGLCFHIGLIKLVGTRRWIVPSLRFILFLLFLLVGLLADLEGRDAVFDELNPDRVVHPWLLLGKVHGLIHDGVFLKRTKLLKGEC